MENIKKLGTFKFNSNFSLVVDESLDKTDLNYLQLKRTFYSGGEEEEVRFSIKDEFKPLCSTVRYVTTSVREKALSEMKEKFPNEYKILKGETDEKPVQIISDSGVSMNELVKSMEQMSKAINKAFDKQANPYEEAIVNAIIEKGQDISAESLLERATNSLDSYIRETYGALPKRIEIIQDGVKKKDISGIFHKKFDTILKIIQKNVPLLLVGPAGSGKNYTLEQVAEALDLEFYFTNAITQEYKLTGFIDANGNYHETQFFKAFKDGGIFFLDEMDASIPEVLIMLNAAIANRYFDFPTGKIKAHDDFRVVAAANTVGMGANNIYVGRNQLDGATLDRFAQIEFNYDSEVEKQLASSVELYDFIVDLRNSIALADVRYIVSMRATINASKLDGLLSATELIESVILKGMSVDEMRLLVDNLTSKNSYTQAFKAMI